MDAIGNFCRNSSGATSIEYALIATGISIVILVALTRIGTSLQGKFYGPIAAGFN